MNASASTRHHESGLRRRAEKTAALAIYHLLEAAVSVKELLW